MGAEREKEDAKICSVVRAQVPMASQLQLRGVPGGIEVSTTLQQNLQTSPGSGAPTAKRLQQAPREACT